MGEGSARELSTRKRAYSPARGRRVSPRRARGTMANYGEEGPYCTGVELRKKGAAGFHGR
jgi:hypothetical protein